MEARGALHFHYILNAFRASSLTRAERKEISFLNVTASVIACTETLRQTATGDRLKAGTNLMIGL